MSHRTARSQQQNRNLLLHKLQYLLRWRLVLLSNIAVIHLAYTVAPELMVFLLFLLQPAGSRKRLLSAVVVDGETRLPSQVQYAVNTQQQQPNFLWAAFKAVQCTLQSDESMTAKRPKPDDVEDNPAAKKRNRRMFGFLNQTLQKCK